MGWREELQKSINNNHKYLNLSRGDISIGEYKEFFSELNNTMITQLSLYSNQIGDAGAIALADSLKGITNITKLDLHNNEIGEAGAKALAESLKDNPNITVLYLWGNKIGDAGAKALVEGLKDNPNITELSLGDNQIGEEGAIALAESLKGSQITTLYLEYNQIGDAGAIALAGALKDNPNITELNLGNNQIGGEGAKALVEGLKDNPNITVLNLENNQIGEEGAIALAEGLKGSQITTLNLDENKIGKEGEKAIKDALEENYQRIRDVQNKFKDIFKNEELSEKEKLELIKIVKEHGIDTFLSDIKAFEKAQRKEVTDKLDDIIECGYGLLHYDLGKNKETQEAKVEYEKSIKHFENAIQLNDDNYSFHYGLAKTYQAYTKLGPSKAFSLLYYEKAIKKAIEKAREMDCDISDICLDRGKFLYKEANYKEAIKSFNLLIEQKNDNPFFYILRANAYLKLWDQLRKIEAENSEEKQQAAIKDYKKIYELKENDLSEQDKAFIEKCLKYFIPIASDDTKNEKIQKAKNEAVELLFKLIETEEIRLNLENQEKFMKIMCQKKDYIKMLSLGIDKICEEDGLFSKLETDISKSVEKFYESLGLQKTATSSYSEEAPQADESLSVADAEDLSKDASESYSEEEPQADEASMQSATPDDVHFLPAASSEEVDYPKSSVAAYVEKSELEEIYNFIQQLKEERDQDRAENAELKAQISALEAQNSEIATLRGQVFELDKQNADLLHNQHLLDKQNATLKGQVSSLETRTSEIDLLRDQVSELTSQLSQQKEQPSVDQQNPQVNTAEEVRQSDEVDVMPQASGSEVASRSDDGSFTLVPPGNADSVESGSVELAGELNSDG